MTPPPNVLAWLSSVLTTYPEPQIVYGHAVQTLDSFPTLRPRTQVYTYEDGTSHLLLNFHGTLPTPIAGVTYQIPIEIWFPLSYPHQAPFLYVVPTQTMAIAPSNHVDPSGRLYHPMLANWSPS
ncbi:hypothetical protein CANCADRAFT_20985, partial [Tortispora caseinolytica NRRL Y-17796]